MSCTGSHTLKLSWPLAMRASAALDTSARCAGRQYSYAGFIADPGSSGGLLSPCVEQLLPVSCTNSSMRTFPCLHDVCMQGCLSLQFNISELSRGKVFVQYRLYLSKPAPSYSVLACESHRVLLQLPPEKLISAKNWYKRLMRPRNMVSPS